jgi:ribosomal protein S3
MISNSMERFGTGRFKGIGHKAMTEAMRSGALGIEILISGKVPSQRAKTWRFYNGYLKKCGDVAIEGVDIAYRVAVLKTGVVGIKVSVMPPTTILPDRIDINPEEPGIIEDITGSSKAADVEVAVEAKSAATEEKPKRAPRKKAESADAAEKPKRAPRKKKEETTEGAVPAVASEVISEVISEVASEATPEPVSEEPKVAE